MNVSSMKFDFPKYMDKPRIYIIATQPRCGSHLTAHILRESKLAGCPLEYFHTRHWDSWLKRCRSSNPVYAFRILCQRRTSPNGIFGLKSHWHQFAHAIEAGLEGELEGSSFLYLCRNDVLGQAISLVIASQSGVWIGGQRATGRPVFSFDQICESINYILNERRNWERFFAYTGITPYRITYEDLCLNLHGCMERILNYIGVEYNIHEYTTPPTQRTSLNEDWRTRFESIARERYDTGEFWREEFLR